MEIQHFRGFSSFPDSFQETESGETDFREQLTDPFLGIR